jgi:Methyltransferase domain
MRTSMTAAGRAGDGEGAVDGPDPCLQPGQSPAWLDAGVAVAVVFDDDAQVTAVDSDRYRDAAGACVLGDVGEGLGGDVVGGCFPDWVRALRDICAQGDRDRAAGDQGRQGGVQAASVEDRRVDAPHEFACGPGVWTGQLLCHATDVTAVDASPEMLALAAARVRGERVRFVQADVFTWKPDRRYDVVFMGFWLSHVPAERFGSFWSLVADCLKPAGRVFFADDAYRTPEELVAGPSSETIRRQIPDGTAYRLVKVPHRPADLQGQLQDLGWDVTVDSTAGPVYWGAGRRAATGG